MFPTPPREGITPPRDAIILEAPQGAKLQFDDFRPELGRIGQITRRPVSRPDHDSQRHARAGAGGRSAGRNGRPGDEHEAAVQRLSPVRFRMGQNVGGGRELEIRFLADEHVQPKDQGLKIAGIDSLEIRRDVRMRLQLDTDSLLPGGEADQATQAPATAAARPSR